MQARHSKAGTLRCLSLGASWQWLEETIGVLDGELERTRACWIGNDGRASRVTGLEALFLRTCTRSAAAAHHKAECGSQVYASIARVGDDEDGEDVRACWIGNEERNELLG